jgi:hypothetical protein
MTLHPLAARRQARREAAMVQVVALRTIARNSRRPLETSAARYAH